MAKNSSLFAVPSNRTFVEADRCPLMAETYATGSAGFRLRGNVSDCRNEVIRIASNGRKLANLGGIHYLLQRLILRC